MENKVDAVIRIAFNNGYVRGCGCDASKKDIDKFMESKLVVELLKSISYEECIVCKGTGLVTGNDGKFDGHACYICKGSGNSHNYH